MTPQQIEQYMPAVGAAAFLRSAAKRGDLREIPHSEVRRLIRLAEKRDHERKNHMSTAPAGIPPLWMNRIRPNLPPPPRRIAGLPIDDRGYPVPFFVAWPDGKPDHRIADEGKRRRCVAQDLCWLCGDTLGQYRVFVLGPMCGVTMTSSDAPAHLDCARWAAMACPFLANPGAKRREVKPTAGVEVEEPGGIMIKRNPGVTLLWTASSYRFQLTPGESKPLFRLVGPPQALESYTCGRPATFEETWAAVESGFGLLQAQVSGEGEAQQLAAAVARFEGQLRQFLGDR
jgi:hypothetical protein